MATTAKALSALTFVYLVTFFTDTFHPTAAGRYVMVAALAGIHILAFGRVKKGSRNISTFLNILGAVLLLYNGATTEDWLKALLNNAPVICLLLTVSLFTIPLYFEPYHEVLYKNLPRFAKSPFQFYALTLTFTAALASLLNVASLPFIHNLLKDAAAKYRDEALTYSLTRGVSINMLWSPAFISVAIVVQFASVSWLEILPGSAMIALAAYLLALLFGVFEFKGQKLPSEEVADSGLKLILAKLFLSLSILMIFIAVLQHLTGKSALVTVPLVSVTGPLLLALLFSRLGVYKAKIRDYFTTTLPNTYSEMILFTSFGVFGYGLGLSDLKTYIPLTIQYLGFDSPLALIPLITFLTAFPCLFGIHPFITISTVAIALPPGSIPLTKVQMAGALLLAYMNYGNLSPFSAVNLVILGLTKADPLKATFRQNWPYAIALTLVATVILTYLPL